LTGCEAEPPLAKFSTPRAFYIFSPQGVD